MEWFIHKGEFFLHLRINRDFFLFQIHHHIGTIIDKMLTITFGSLWGETFIGVDIG